MLGCRRTNYLHGVDRSGELKIGLLAPWPLLAQGAAQVHICRKFNKSKLQQVPTPRLAHARREILGMGDRA